jgi:DNA repair photolyase
MAVRLVYVKGSLQRSRLPGGGYVVNPYTGCAHGCVYCYARFMKRFTGHSEAWGSFLDAKVNGPEVLRAELARRRAPIRETVFLSSVTDPYQPAEKKHQLTRRALEALLEHQVPISILTKSDLVVRDLDLLSRFESCSVGLSLSTLDEVLARRLEPRAASPAKRVSALRTLSDCGVDTYAFISPFLPGITDLDLLLETLSGSIDEIGVEAINRRGGNWRGIERALGHDYPELLKECGSLAREECYWSALEQRAIQLADQHRVSMTGFYRH